MSAVKLWKEPSLMLQEMPKAMVWFCCLQLVHHLINTRILKFAVMRLLNMLQSCPAQS